MRAPVSTSDAAPGLILPRLVLVADGFAGGRPRMSARDVRARALEAVAAGLPWVLLRDYSVADPEFDAVSEDVAAELRAVNPTVMLSVSRQASLARRLGAGVHTGAVGPSVAEARGIAGPDAPIGYSAHSPEGAQQAAGAGADYVFAGSVYPTRSHPGRAPLGLATLRAACRAAHPTPVMAIGGMTAGQLAEVVEAGAYGAAVAGALLDASNTSVATHALLDALGRAPARTSRPLPT